jgi:N-acetylglucosamine kinase-like BadF-type ATPase
MIVLERLANMSKVLFAVAATGDEVAQRVMARQAMKIVALVTVAANRLRPSGL